MSLPSTDVSPHLMTYLTGKVARMKTGLPWAWQSNGKWQHLWHGKCLKGQVWRNEKFCLGPVLCSECNTPSLEFIAEERGANYTKLLQLHSRNVFRKRTVTPVSRGVPSNECQGTANMKTGILIIPEVHSLQVVWSQDWNAWHNSGYTLSSQNW